MWFNSTKVISLLLALVVLAGCRRAEPLGKITGQVTLDGEPVWPGIVIFSDPQKGVHIMAELRSDGSYEMQTAGGFGLPLGTYQVAVNPPAPTPPMPGMPQPPQQVSVPIPPKYLQPSTSGLQTRIEKGENVFNIAMQSSER